MTRRKTDRKQKKKRQFTQQATENKNVNAKKKPRSHRLRNSVVLIASILIVLSGCVLCINLPSEPLHAEDTPPANMTTPANVTTPVNAPKAAILDGLYDESPNVTWTENIVQCLSNSGYTVDSYRGTGVTISLLREISGYKLLILRLHSAIGIDNFLYLFSGEKYTENKYANEQLAGAVRKARIFNESETYYFALNSVFLGKLEPNALNGTTIILMGCNGTTNQYIIQRFFQEGAKEYISWNGYVNLPHSDEATLRLIKAIYSDKINPKTAVEKVNKELGQDPAYKTKLLYYSP